MCKVIYYMKCMRVDFVYVHGMIIAKATHNKILLNGILKKSHSEQNTYM